MTRRSAWITLVKTALKLAACPCCICVVMSHLTILENPSIVLLELSSTAWVWAHGRVRGAACRAATHALRAHSLIAWEMANGLARSAAYRVNTAVQLAHSSIAWETVYGVARRVAYKVTTGALLARSSTAWEMAYGLARSAA